MASGNQSNIITLRTDFNGDGKDEAFSGTATELNAKLAQTEALLTDAMTHNELLETNIANLKTAAELRALEFGINETVDAGSLLSFIVKSPTSTAGKLAIAISEMQSFKDDIADYYDTITNDKLSVGEKLTQTLNFSLKLADKLFDAFDNAIFKKLIDTNEVRLTIESMRNEYNSMLNDMNDFAQSSVSYEKQLSEWMTRQQNLQESINEINDALEGTEPESGSVPLSPTTSQTLDLSQFGYEAGDLVTVSIAGDVRTSANPSSLPYYLDIHQVHNLSYNGVLVGTGADWSVDLLLGDNLVLDLINWDIEFGADNNSDPDGDYHVEFAPTVIIVPTGIAPTTDLSV